MYLHGILDTITQWTGDKIREGVAAYRAKQKQFQLRYRALLDNPPPVGASLEAKQEYDELLADSREIVNKLGWVDSQLNAIARATGFRLGSLGVLPVAVIPVAVVSVIAGATYLIGKMIDRTDAYLREVKGLPPPQESGGLFSEVGKAASGVIWPIAIVAGLFVFGPELMKGRRK